MGLDGYHIYVGLLRAPYVLIFDQFQKQGEYFQSKNFVIAAEETKYECSSFEQEIEI